MGFMAITVSEVGRYAFVASLDGKQPSENAQAACKSFTGRLW